MKVRLWSDEYCPWYGIDRRNANGVMIDLTEEEIEQGRKAQDAFDAWQTLLAAKETEWKIAREHNT